MTDRVDRDHLAYLDRLYAAAAGGPGFVVRAFGPGDERELPVAVLRVSPPLGRQRKPQVVWRWADEDETTERTCSVGTFRRFTSREGVTA